MINQITTTLHDLRAKGIDIIDLTSGNPLAEGFHFPSSILEEAYRAPLQHQSYRPDPKGYLEARTTINDYYKQHDLHLTPDQIVITSGTSESFLYLFRLLCNADDTILVPLPSYPLLEHIADVARVKVKHYRLDEASGWRIDFESLLDQIDQQTKAILLVSPHNPTGMVVTKEEIKKISEIAREKNIAVICDEVFSEFYYGEEDFPRVACHGDFPLLFTLNGISKMFALPHLKLGWIAVSGEKKRVLQAIESLELLVDTFLTTHTPIQQALPFIFEKGQIFLQEYRSELKRRKEIACALLSQIQQYKFTYPIGGFYLIVKVNSEHQHDEEEFVLHLLQEHHLLLHPGYFYDYEKGVHCIISFLCREDRLKAGIQKISDCLHSSPL